MKNRIDGINKLKEQISIVETISSYLQLSKKGNNYVGVCPFHADKSPSLTVNETKKIFKCFACNVSGDVFSFVSKIEHIGYYDAILKISEQHHINLNEFQTLTTVFKKSQENEKYYAINAKACEYFHNFLFNKENQYALKYLNDRQIDKEIIDYFKIGFAPEDANIMISLLSNANNILGNEDLGFKIKDINDCGLTSVDNKNHSLICLFTNRVIFPIYNTNQNVIGFGGRTITNDSAKYVNTPTTEVFNKSEVLFNLNNIVANNIDVEEVYLVEGYLDVIALHKIGIKNAVATMGVAFSEKHLETITILPKLKVINICYDNDTAGQSSALKTAHLIQKKYLVSLLDYQSEFKDIDEIVCHSKELASEQIKNLVDFTTYQINKLFKNIDFNSPNARRIFLEEAIDILNKEKDIVSLNDNILKISSTLNIEKEMIISRLKPIKSSLPIRKKDKFRANVDIDFEREIKCKEKPTSAIATTASENEILVCLFLSRECVGIFEEKCNIFLDQINNEIFNIIQDFYFNHPEVNEIGADDIKEIFSDHQELLPRVMEIAIKKEKINLKNIQERLAKTIDRQMFLIKKEGYKKVLEKMKTSNYDSQIELLKKVFNN